MSLRWRAPSDGGELLCGAKSKVLPDDTYIDDRLHYRFSVECLGVVKPDADEKTTGKWSWPDPVTEGDTGDTLYAIFHELWGKAVDTPGYNKRRWQRFEELIRSCFGVRDAKPISKPGYSMVKQGNKMYASNLITALTLAIEARAKHGKGRGYRGDSGLLAGWRDVLDALNKGEHVEIHECKKVKAASHCSSRSGDS